MIRLYLLKELFSNLHLNNKPNLLPLFNLDKRKDYFRALMVIHHHLMKLLANISLLPNLKSKIYKWKLEKILLLLGWMILVPRMIIIGNFSFLSCFSFENQGFLCKKKIVKCIVGSNSSYL